MVLFKDDDEVKIINEIMRYSFKFKGKFNVLNNRLKYGNNYRYSGLTLGIFQDKEGNLEMDQNKYDFLIAIDSEMFSKKISDINYFEKSCRHRLADHNFKRDSIETGKKYLIYSFRTANAPYFSGYEGIFINNNYGYMMRIIIPSARLGRFDNTMEKIIKEFKTVSRVE